MRRTTLCCALSAVLLATAADAEVYRCSEAGKSVYSDRPCQSGPSATIPVPSGSAQPDAINLQNEANMGRLAVGQTPVQVEMAWGRPKTKNVDSGSAGRAEQWVYERTDGAAYVYFRKGLLSSYSERLEGLKATNGALPAATELSQIEIDNKERADKASERRFIRERTAAGDVRKRIGEPDAKVFRGTQECWYYAATRLDPQTNTRICYDLNSTVFDIERVVVR